MADVARLEDIHDKTLEERVHELMEKETIELSTREREFVDSNCPACGDHDREHRYTILGLKYHECGTCRTLYISPCPTDAHISEFLQTSEGLRIWREEMPARVKQSRRNMYRRRLEDTLRVASANAVTPDVVVEVGGGSGEFATEAVEAKAFGQLIVVEPQPLELSLPGVRVVAGSFQEIDLDGEADLLVSFEVLEHLINPRDFLEMAQRSLRPGGILYLTTPNAESLEVWALGDKSHTLPFDHIRLYNPVAMRHLLDGTGFDLLTVETPGALDVQILERARAGGELDVSRNPALQFLLEDEELGARFQTFLQEHLLSSHMRVVARRR